MGFIVVAARESAWGVVNAARRAVVLGLTRSIVLALGKGEC
ncbi:hypothetical protein [Salinispora arenicola]|nr:hypothetical protein [Salinispora arenicola]